MCILSEAMLIGRAFKKLSFGVNYLVLRRSRKLAQITAFVRFPICMNPLLGDQIRVQTTGLANARTL